MAPAINVVIHPATARVAPRALQPDPGSLCTGLGGAAIALGACLPWMYYFAGLMPLRGLIGLNGRLFFAAGIVSIALAVARVLTFVGTRGGWRVLTAVIGAAVSLGAVWLLLGVRELIHAPGSNAMLAPKPGSGLWVVLFGGVLVALAAAIPPTKGQRRPISPLHGV